MLHTIAKFGANEIRDSGRLYSCAFRRKHYHRNASQTFGRSVIHFWWIYSTPMVAPPATWSIVTRPVEKSWHLFDPSFWVLLLFLPCKKWWWSWQNTYEAGDKNTFVTIKTIVGSSNSAQVTLTRSLSRNLLFLSWLELIWVFWNYLSFDKSYFFVVLFIRKMSLMETM